MDVKIAILHTKQSKGYVVPGKEHLVRMPKKNLYRLTQSPRQMVLEN